MAWQIARPRQEFMKTFIKCCDHTFIKQGCSCHRCSGNSCNFIAVKLASIFKDYQVQFISRLSVDEFELFTADLIDALDILIEEWGN